MNSSLGGDPCRSTHRRRSAFRILFAFDPRRTAILLVGGDKAGATRFYERAIEAADRIYDAHLRAIKPPGSEP
jgi:hypothetical protein